MSTVDLVPQLHDPLILNRYLVVEFLHLLHQLQFQFLLDVLHALDDLQEIVGSLCEFGLEFAEIVLHNLHLVLQLVLPPEDYGHLVAELLVHHLDEVLQTLQLLVRVNEVVIVALESHLTHLQVLYRGTLVIDRVLYVSHLFTHDFSLLQGWLDEVVNVSSDLALKMIPVLVIEGSTSLLEDLVNGRLLHLRRPVHVIHSDMSLINLDRYSLLLGDNWVLFLLRKLLLRPFALLSGSSRPSGCDRHLKLFLVILGCQLL